MNGLELTLRPVFFSALAGERMTSVGRALFPLIVVDDGPSDG